MSQKKTYAELRDSLKGANATKAVREQQEREDLVSALAELRLDFVGESIPDADLLKELVAAKLLESGFESYSVQIREPNLQHDEMAKDPAKYAWIIAGENTADAYNVYAREENGSPVVYIWRVPEGGNLR